MKAANTTQDSNELPLPYNWKQDENQYYLVDFGGIYYSREPRIFLKLRLHLEKLLQPS